MSDSTPADPAPAPRGLGGRAALDAFRAARAAARHDLRASLRANRDALRTARLGTVMATTPPAEAVNEKAQPVVPSAPASLSVFARLLDAERALAPEPSLPPKTAAMVPVQPDLPMVAEDPPEHDEPEADYIVPCAETDDSPSVVAGPEAATETPAESAEAFAADTVLEPEIVGCTEAPAEIPADEPMPEAAVALLDEIVVAPRPSTGLHVIRELGPGMRHRLAQLGYHCCEDLAAAESDRLAQQLGEVSRLLRPDRWIAAAREACA